MNVQSAPQRIQLRRTKGWRKPEGAVVVARPSKWGNPWPVGTNVQITATPLRAGGEWPYLSRIITPALAVDLFRISTGDWTAVTVAELRGRDLACWCPLDEPCHADVLLAIANGRRVT